MNTLELILQALAKNATTPAASESPSHKATSRSATSTVSGAPANNAPTGYRESGAAPITTGSHRESAAPPAVTPAPSCPAALDRAPAAHSIAPLVHPDDGKPLGAACKPGARVDWSRMPQRSRRSEPLDCDDTPRVSRALAVIDRLRRYSQAS